MGNVNLQDLTGLRFGFLLVKERAPNYITSGGISMVNWRCQCDCGSTCNAHAGDLRSSKKRSCGRACKARRSAKLLSLKLRKSKVCSLCKVEKPIGEFHKNRTRSSGVISRCKTCWALTGQDWAHKNKDKIKLARARHYMSNKESIRSYTLQRAYGITLDEYKRIAISQNSRCAICGQRPGQVLQVDHNHITGKVRGLLCNQCNSGLGSFKTDSQKTKLLQKAAQYILDKG